MNVFSVAFGSTTDRSVIIGTIAKIIYVTNFESASPVFTLDKNNIETDRFLLGNSTTTVNLQVILIGQNQLC